MKGRKIYTVNNLHGLHYKLDCVLKNSNFSTNVHIRFFSFRKKGRLYKHFVFPNVYHTHGFTGYTHK